MFSSGHVDNVISAISVNEVEHLLWCLNSVKPSIQFTFEQENERCLPSLDVNILRTERWNLETSVYCKPTHTDKYFGFGSHHPICHKKFVTRTLLMKAECPSSYDLRKKSVIVHCVEGQCLPENFHLYLLTTSSFFTWDFGGRGCNCRFFGFPIHSWHYRTHKKKFGWPQC